MKESLLSSLRNAKVNQVCSSRRGIERWVPWALAPKGVLLGASCRTWFLSSTPPSRTSTRASTLSSHRILTLSHCVSISAPCPRTHAEHASLTLEWLRLARPHVRLTHCPASVQQASFIRRSSSGIRVKSATHRTGGRRRRRRGRRSSHEHRVAAASLVQAGHGSRWGAEG